MKLRGLMGEYDNTTVDEFEQAEELKGKLAAQTEEDKLMRSVLQNNKDRVDNGKMIIIRWQNRYLARN